MSANSRERVAQVPPVTPDGRYVVVKGRLWRAANPNLSDEEKGLIVQRLMEARRALRGTVSIEKRNAARALVDQTKRLLGERGPVWWSDGAPDLNRKLVKNTPYAGWHRSLSNDSL